MVKPVSETKVALVTGAARRIGAEIARVLHAAGINIVLHYNASEEEANKLSDNIESSASKFLYRAPIRLASRK